MPPRTNWDDGIRCAVLTLFSNGTTAKEIQAKYGMSRYTLSEMKKRAISRGWVPGSPVLLKHVEHAPKSGMKSFEDI